MKSGLNRLEALEQISAEWHGGRLASRLSQSEMGKVVAFIRETDRLSPSEFSAKVAVLYTNGEPRPKHHGEIQELLSMVASRVSR